MKFSHIKETCLYIQDLDRTASFYHGKLGFPIIGRVEGGHIFFRVGKSVLLCFIPASSRQKTDLPPHYAEGKQHLAFECEAEEYEAWKQRLKNLQIEIIQEVKWGKKYRSCYFCDPDGHVLEIVEPGMWG